MAGASPWCSKGGKKLVSFLGADQNEAFNLLHFARGVRCRVTQISVIVSMMPLAKRMKVWKKAMPFEGMIRRNFTC